MLTFVSIAEYLPSAGEFNSGVSMTVPDQTLSIREILDRYTSDQLLPRLSKPGVYDDDVDVIVPDLKTMDLVDLQDLQDEVRGYIASAQIRAVEMQNADSQVSASGPAAKPAADDGGTVD